MAFPETLLCLSVIVCSCLAAHTPQWKNLLIHHSRWLGFYRHDGGSYDCTLKVNSVGLDEEQDAFVTFTAQHVDMDMTVSSEDDVLVRFEETSTWHKQTHFSGHSGLVFEVHVKPYSDYHYFVGNVSSVEESGFGTINIRPKGVGVRVSTSGHNDDLKYGLSIGIPVFLAVCLTVAGIVILWWAFKKGYLRHIPSAYKTFTNPRGTDRADNPADPTPDPAQPGSSHEMTPGGEFYNIEQPGSVHI